MSHGSGAPQAEPNLTPILDLVFQLITFFMLIINFKSAEIDTNLKLPIIGSAKPVKTDGRVGVLVLNIDRDGSLKTTQTIRDIDNFFRIQAHATQMAQNLKPSETGEPPELPTTVVIRADCATSFRSLNRVIKACQDNGFRNFALKAAPPKKKREA